MNTRYSFLVATSLLLATLGITQGVAQIPTEGLVAYYPFNGNANDESGNENDGMVLGATLCTDRFGNHNSAYSFDGMDDYITVPNSASLQLPQDSVSLAAWVFVNHWYNGWVAVCAKSNSAVRGQYAIAFQPGGRIDVDVAGTVVYLFTDFQFQLHTWYFVSMTWDGANLYVYANGNAVGYQSVSVPPSTNSLPLEIGRHTPTNTEYMDGTLDDIRVYDRTLTPADMESLYHEGGWATQIPDLLAFYPFNGTTEDESGNGNDATLLGGATVTTHLILGDNSADALSIPYTVLNGLTDYTFSGVIRINSIHTTGGFGAAANTWISGAASFHPAGNGFNIVYDGTLLTWRTLIVPPFQVNYYFDHDARVEDHQPHHITVSRQGVETRLYLDGSMIGYPTIVPDTAIVCDPSGFIIGQDQDVVGGGFDGNQSFAGEVDNLRIFSRALTDQEVLELCALDGMVVTDVPGNGNVESPVPNQYALMQNYPNPFNPSTVIQYQLPASGDVTLTVFDILGKKVAILIDGNQSAGTHSAVFDATEVGSGTYFYRLNAGNFVETKKLLVVK